MESVSVVIILFLMAASIIRVAVKNYFNKKYLPK